MKNSRQILAMLVLFIVMPCIASDEPVVYNENTEKTKNLTEQLNTFLDLQTIEIKDKGFRSEVKIGNIDPRLNLKSCANDIQFSLNRSAFEQQNLTLLAKCDNIKPWKIYISVTIKIFGKVVTAKNTIRRGQLITVEQLDYQEEIINLNRYTSYSSKSDIIGMLAKRSIRSNAIIQANYLAQPKLISRGDNVVIVASNSAISVRMNGTALMDGSLGEQISIKNSQSDRIIKARVADTGLVNVIL
jgi:flagella basal body P-ring formation protein FlgA